MNVATAGRTSTCSVPQRSQVASTAATMAVCGHVEMPSAQETRISPGIVGDCADAIDPRRG